jgi:hypothetical protein
VRRTRYAFLLTIATLLLVTACGSEGAPRLSVQWEHDGAGTRAVLPSEALQTAVYIKNEGSSSIEGLVLRFDHVDTGMLPFGLTLGTATRVSSRFDGNAQVWDLGKLEPGQTMVFPMSIWFDSSTVTMEPRHVRLVIHAESPDLEGQSVSNALEVEVDTRAAVTGR